MTDVVRNPDDFCYRHPERPSFVLCERCGRTICLECQNHIDGRVLCPDHAVAARVTPISAASGRTRRRRRLQAPVVPAALEGHPVITYLILAVGLLLYLVDLVAGGIIEPYLFVYPAGSIIHNIVFQPWAFVLSALSNNSILGLLLGGFSLYSLGRFTEPYFGRRKFVTLYVGGGVGASIVSLALGGANASWFGAIFALAAAAIVFARRMGIQPIFLYVSAGVNLILSLFLGGWQAVLGSLLAGGGIAFMYYFEDEPGRRTQIRIALVIGGVVLLALGVVQALRTVFAS